MGRLAVNGLAPNFRVCDQRVGAASISQSAADAIAALGPQYCSRPLAILTRSASFDVARFSRPDRGDG